MPWQSSRPPRPSWQLQAAHEPVGRSSSTLPNPSIFLAGLWLQPPLPLRSWTSAALTLPSRHSAHIRVGPADFGMPAPTQEERSALTKSASPPAKPTFRENRIEVAFSDRIEDTACISSTASTISIMEKVASWVALDWLRPGGLAPPRAARASIRALSKPVGDKAAMSPPSTKTAPYGSWKSPITSELIVAQSITLSEVCLDGRHVYWLEGRPQEQGRYVVVRADADGQPTDITPPPYNARTRVHEYGGGSWTVHNGMVYFSNFADGRLYRQVPGTS